MKMSPREIFALRDYLGAELKGRTHVGCAAQRCR